MKSDASHKGFPASLEEWEQLIAAAPGEDRPLSPEEEEAFWRSAVVVKEGGYPAVQAALAEKRRLRGRQKTPRKVSTTVRFDAEVLAAFRATGRGWQTRMNEALKEWLRTHSV